MESFLRWLAGIGNEALPAGESLRFEFLALPKGTLGFILVVLFLAVGAGVFLIYRRDAAKLSFGKRTTLAVLRLLALAMVALILLEPSLVKVRKIVRPGEVLLLVDSSQSMAHKDSYVRSPEWKDGWTAVGIDDPSASRRIDMVRKLLGQNGLIDSLAAKNRLRVYLFGGGVRPAPEVEKAAEKDAENEPEKTPDAKKGAAQQANDKLANALPPPPDLEVEKIEASEGSTNLTASLRQALEGSRDARIAAVIVVSDGRRNSGGSPEEAGAYLVRRKVGSVYAIGVGDPAETWSVAVREIQAAERVFKGDPLKVSAIVTSEGYGDQTLTVRLSEVGADGKKIRDLHSVNVDIGGDKTSAEARFPPITLVKEGEHFLRVEVDPPPEEKREERHAKTHRVEVLGERLRVLLLAGAPNHEYRILRDQLIRDNTVEVSCWLQSADKEFPQDGNTSIKDLPAKPEELDAYDVLVLADPDPVLFPIKLIGMIRKAVEDRGLGLWWVMGEKFSLANVRPGSPMRPLVDLLPIEPDIQAAEHMLNLGRYYRTMYPFKLTAAGKEHRVAALLSDPVINETLWSKLPGFYWWFPVARAKPAARVLIRHSSNRERAEDGPMPIMALQFVGAGRVIYSGTDETFRWRSVAQPAYNQLWVKGLRWLYEGKLTGGSSRYRLGVSAEKMTLGQEIEIYLRALDTNFEPSQASTMRIRLMGPGGITKEIELPRAPVGEGRFRGEFRPNAVGTWTVVAISNDGASTETAGRPVMFEVQRSELESKGPMGLAELTRFAESAGGKLIKPAELAEIAPQIRGFSTEETFTVPQPLWDKWLSLLLIVLFLTIEWVLRKRFDLL